MDTTDKFMIGIIVFSILALLAFITIISILPTSSERIYAQCIKISQNVKDCESLLINNN